jgi:hypothetical protein
MARDEITKERAEELKRQVERGFNERAPKLIEELLADHLVDPTSCSGESTSGSGWPGSSKRSRTPS